MFMGVTKHLLMCDVNVLNIFPITRHFAFSLPRIKNRDSLVNVVTTAWTE
jgi:hypothetical protein